MAPPGTPTYHSGDGYACYVLPQGDTTLPKLYSIGADLEINFLIAENDRLDLSAYVKNIEDKPILTNYTIEGPAYASLAPPRTFGVTLNAKF
jgi:hypothetical protein